MRDAYALMGNRHHEAADTPEAHLVAGMGWLQNAITRRYHLKNGLCGHLFGGRSLRGGACRRRGDGQRWKKNDESLA